MLRGALLLLALVVLAAACADGSRDLVGHEVVKQVPWTGPETARYRVTQGDLEGTGVLSIEPRDGELLLRQEFQGGEFRDRVSAVVDAATMRPRRVSRVIEGPDGTRECRGDYEGGVVVVEDRSGEDVRTDELDVPSPSYDSWTDIFLWRTVQFVPGFEVSYVDVRACKLAKPELISVTLKVVGREEVEVPAGTFQTWRVEIRTGGRTQKAWFADLPEKTLVRYDNGFQLFELESVE